MADDARGSGGRHTCRYCDHESDGERSHLRHLARAHPSGELGRVDRRRVEAAFAGRRTWWTDLLAERLSASPPAGAVAWFRTLDSPVPRRTLLSLALLGAVLSLGVTAALAMSGP